MSAYVAHAQPCALSEVQEYASTPLDARYRSGLIGRAAAAPVATQPIFDLHPMTTGDWTHRHVPNPSILAFVDLIPLSLAILTVYTI